MKFNIICFSIATTFLCVYLATSNVFFIVLFAVYAGCLAAEILVICIEYFARKSLDDSNLISDCGCRFKNKHSNSGELCKECSKLPCHNQDQSIE
jgi:hypothetical protein